jgi:hypothetical protein
MLKLKQDFIGFLPIISFLLFLWGKTLWATGKYGGYPFITTISICFLIFGSLFFIFGPFRTLNVIRLILGISCIMLLLIGILIAIIGEFKGLYFLIVGCWYEGIYGIIILRDLFNIKKNTQSNFSWRINDKKISKILAYFFLYILIGIFNAQLYQFDSRTSLEFEVSESEMVNKEIVLYWVQQTMENPEAFVNILKNTNSVLALQGNPDLFQEIGDYTTKGADAANLVRLCNQAKVKVEIWPVPSTSLHCALSMKFVDCMPTVYEYFKEWVARHNITIDYYAFDIEDYIPLPENFMNSTTGHWVSEKSPFYWTLRGIYEKAATQEFIKNNRSDWNELINQQQKLIDQIIADGFIPRATIQPSVWDALDGDLNDYIKNNMQSYEITGYDYLSGMYYRSCEWGNNDSSYLIYKNAKMLKIVSPYPRSAICIGCIGYPAYKTDQDVANDVWLASKLGIDSVRLFLGDSWVYSAPTEADGLKNLQSMLELCRSGGIAKTEFSAKKEVEIMGIVIDDVLSDL